MSDFSLLEDDLCPYFGCESCECPPLPKCYDCGGSGFTMEGWTCEVCDPENWTYEGPVEPERDTYGLVDGAQDDEGAE